MKIKKLGALLVSVALCAGMAAPAFAYGGEPVEEVEQPVLTSTTDEEDVVTVTDEETGALTPEGNLTLVDDYHTDYSDGSGQQFITLVSKSGATFYLVIDRNAKGQQTVHFMNLVDEADLLSLMEEEEANAYTAEKEAAAQAEQDRLKAEEEAKKAAEEAAASGTEQPKENKVTKIASGFLGVVVLIALAAGGGFYFYHQQMQKGANMNTNSRNVTYSTVGDYQLPNLTLNQPRKPLGKYGRLRRTYLMQYRPVLYNSMLLNGTLYPHLMELEQTAESRMQQTMEQLLKQDPAPDKAQNQLMWVQHMNSLKAQAEELVMTELIYS